MQNILLVFKLLLLVACLNGGVAHAVTISFGGVIALDGSGLTSTFADPNTPRNQPGYAIETFDQSTPQWGGFFPGENRYNDTGFDNDCSVNLANGTSFGVNVTPTAPSTALNVRKGSLLNQAVTPFQNSTCFGYVTGSAQVEFDYSALLNYANEPGISYLGFYWGSVENVNVFQFFSGNNLLGEFTGTQLLTVLGGTSGNPTAPSSNVYVNTFFSLNEKFNRLVIGTTGTAVEIDNIVVQFSTPRPAERVSAPAGAALLAFSLAWLSLRRKVA